MVFFNYSYPIRSYNSTCDRVDLSEIRKETTPVTSEVVVNLLKMPYNFLICSLPNFLTY